ncbi:hypothetical protein Bbelb_073330 [Branchiostoma belcheri]|nr:hypothetical protein Bbelb_073330 [Branchiostoma belcheri]
MQDIVRESAGYLPGACRRPTKEASCKSCVTCPHFASLIGCCVGCGSASARAFGARGRAFGPPVGTAFGRLLAETLKMEAKSPQLYSQNRALQQGLTVQVLQQYMRWEGGDTVMDVGCGTGDICRYISQQPGVASVVGFDLSADFISYARERNSSPNIVYHVGDASDASTFKPEWKGAFGKIVSIFVLHFIQDQVATLKMLHSCLKPGGEILLVTISEKSTIYQVWLELASLPKWEIYMKDFVANMFPWPSSDLVKDSSRLLEECGFQTLACGIKEHRQAFDSKSQILEGIRSVLPSKVPQDKRDEILVDFERIAKDRQWIHTENMVNDAFPVIHGRKL